MNYRPTEYVAFFRCQQNVRLIRKRSKKKSSSRSKRSETIGRLNATTAGLRKEAMSRPRSKLNAKSLFLDGCLRRRRRRPCSGQADRWNYHSHTFGLVPLLRLSTHSLARNTTCQLNSDPAAAAAAAWSYVHWMPPVPAVNGGCALQVSLTQVALPGDGRKERTTTPTGER